MAAGSGPVRYERSGAAAVLTIDRPERRNAIDGPTAELIAEGYDRFVADDDARVLVIAGAGGVAFSAGADLKAIESFAPRMDDPRGPLGISRVISPKPTIAASTGQSFRPDAMRAELPLTMRTVSPTPASTVSTATR